MIKGMEDRLDAVTENLANSQTPGYRSLEITGKVFDTLVGEAVDNYNKGWKDAVQYEPVAINFMQGPIRTTGRKLDFAINGEGFFVVRKDNQDCYTRNGSFNIDLDRRLVDNNGYLLQGESGEIVIPDDVNVSDLTLDEEGILWAGREEIDQLKLARFEDPRDLERVGTTLFASTDKARPQDIEKNSTRVMNGALESSNSTVFEDMVELITTVRSYEACQRMLKAQDEAEGKMITKLGGQ
jgi:flagellar basal-body rod protein FlgG